MIGQHRKSSTSDARWVWAALIAVLWPVTAASGQLTEPRVLLVYNSQNADSLAVRNMYIAARPNVRQFDLNSAFLATRAAPLDGDLTRAQYVTNVRDPIRNFINGTTPPGPDLSQTIVCIVTTRGLPARVEGGFDEFQTNSSYSSIEADLTLLQQNLELAGSGGLPFRYSGHVDNPYHTRLNQPILGFARTGISTARTFQSTLLAPGLSTWIALGLTPGDIYLVCRLDAAPTPGATALENVQALIDRSQNLVVNRCQVQAVFDRCAGPNFLDDDGVGATYPATNDFPNSHAALLAARFPSRLDETFAFLDGPTLPDQLRQVLVVGSYGENHGVCSGANPPGVGTYVESYDIHPAGVFIAYESFNGNSIVDGLQRGGQQQCLDFIARGGSFTVGSVAEPFTIWIPDLEFLTRNLFIHGLTYAEAVYSAIPALSWQQTPIGDPLARVTISDIGLTDVNNDGVTDVLDVIQVAEQSLDVTCDGMFTAADTDVMRQFARTTEAADVGTPSP